MKNFYSYLLCAVSIPLITIDVCNAQSTTLALKSPPAGVTIDGASKEWGDSLSYYNPDKKIHYTIANDKVNLYLVVKTKDPTEQRDIVTAGLTFSVDTKGRKKSAFSTTFPSTDDDNPGSISGAGAGGVETQQQKATKALLTRFKKIGVNGFKAISEDYLGTTNSYGILVAISYDADGALVYEEAIPLELFRAGDLAKGEWSFNIKLNGIEMRGDAPAVETSTVKTVNSRGGTTRKTSDAGQVFKSQAQNTPTIDFWGKFTLAQ